jgi:hypothetical protein
MEAMLNSSLGRTILGMNTLTIGSTSDNQLVLRDDSVGSRHAEIRPEGQGHGIIDLGSNTGTFVNGQRVYPNIPQMLQSGDSVRIGNMTLTYEMTSGSSIAPTVYASPGQPVDLGGYSPTAMTSGGSSAPPTAYGASQSNDLYSTPAPPPVTPPPPTSNPYSVSDPYGGSTPKKRGRRGLWIALGVVAVVIVGGIAGLLFLGHPDPTPTLQAYCNALKSGNYQTAYNQYTSDIQKNYGSQAKFAAQYQALGKVTNCTLSNVDTSNGTGMLKLSYASGGSIVYDDQVTSDKINYQKPHSSTPTLTLLVYCNAYKQGDYQTAYNQYTNAFQQSTYGSEAKFAAIFTEKPSDCVLSNVDDAAGKGIVTLTLSGPKLSYDETLSNENGTWKISNEQEHSTPTSTLNDYCSALKQGDYQTAYNLLSSGQQGQQTEAQFAASFSGLKTTDCALSNVNDTAGTGTITFTYDNGKTGSADYTLVQENGTWKINGQK